MELKEIPVDGIIQPLNRNEVLGLIFRLTAFGAVTYFTIKWMADAIDPTRKQKAEAEKLMREIGVQKIKLSEYEMSIAAHLVDPLIMQVGNEVTIITELKDTVILLIQNRDLFKGSRLLQPPKVNQHLFLYILSCSSSDHEATAMMKAQFMSLWDGLNTDFNYLVTKKSVCVSRSLLYLSDFFTGIGNLRDVQQYVQYMHICTVIRLLFNACHAIFLYCVDPI
uniref:ATPase family AAA domain containing 1b n=1 Tax=Sinocyclocheilus grahami TaxID=75366 RepID=A0A672P242_SINGR